ncbi:hypothetical protein HGRIS_001130 [Hohenbuehelia grisea]|uniref:C2H2-type domain-containing protein n=1 Tax=Hohenbuehelia grisea TaxID=104357 RepID=A0ABR3JPD4_9AGAR
MLNFNIFRHHCCPFPGCTKACRSQSALTKHVRTHGNPNRVPQRSYPHPDNTSDSLLLSNSSHLEDTFEEPPFADEPPEHLNDAEDHPIPPAEPPHAARKIYHPFLTGQPCNVNGQPLAVGTPPPPRDTRPANDWSPFADQAEFHLADLLFRKVEMSAANQTELFEIMNILLARHGDQSPFETPKEMYDTIDSITLSDVPWQCFHSTFGDDLGPDAPSWKRQPLEIWYRDPDAVLENMIANTDFQGEFDYQPYVQLDESGKRCWTDFMSGNFAWRQSDKIHEENSQQNNGAMYCSIITGSDKTTVSVATGHVEYHPAYISIGNVRNNVRRAHRNAVVPFIFFAIPKSERKYDNDPEFRKFKRQLIHKCYSHVFQTVKASMSTPVVRRCPDGHFRRVIFDLGPVLADYPEQVMLAGVVQGWCIKCTALPSNLDHYEDTLLRGRDYTDNLVDTFDPGTLWDEFGIDCDIVPFTNDFPRADIHELLAPDLLHQLIKGTFKDHLVTWVHQYLIVEHGKTQAEVIMDEIDRRIAAIPLFPQLRRFPDGRRFKQWTGDDSKALMKVDLPCLVDYVPSEILKTFSTFLDFCYLARRTSFNEDTVTNLRTRLQAFHHFREVFRTSGVRPKGFALPRQHAMSHYPDLIPEFGAPYGLCTSITESRHITAVKKPWRRSNRFNALGQMLVTNQRLDKLAALHTDFVAHGMLLPTHNIPQADEDYDEGPIDDSAVVTGSVVLAQRRARGYPSDLAALAVRIKLPQLAIMTQRFLWDQLNPHSPYSAEEVPAFALPNIRSPISVFHSAVATYYAPSDIAGLHGMLRERLRCTPSWRGKGPRRDCAFVVEDDAQPGMLGLSVVWLRLLFSFKHDNKRFECALVEWFNRVAQQPDGELGLWVAEPDMRGHRKRAPYLSVVHLDCLLRAAHLIPVFGRKPLPRTFKYQHSLGAFQAFYVNKYIDYHTFELLM